MFNYNVVRDVTQYEIRGSVRTIFKDRMAPYPYDTNVFWPEETVILNRDLIEYSGSDNVAVNGKDFNYVDQYAVSADRQEDGHETTLELISRPPYSDKVPYGVLDITISIRSPHFPRLAMYECAIQFVADRNIFDSQQIRQIDVAFDKSKEIRLVGDVLNVYRTTNRRLDNWYMIKFCQVLEILDPRVAVRVRVRINRLGKHNDQIDMGTKLDITPVLSWYTSVTKFLGVGEGSDDGSRSPELEGSYEILDDPPPSGSS